MSDWIGDVFTSDVGWSHLETLVDIGNRMAGSDGERRAAERTRDALADAGAHDAHLDEFDIQGWERGESAIETGATTEECIALPRSPSGTATGEFVDVGHGIPQDFEDADCAGAVVMAASDVPDWYDRHLHRREKYFRAIGQGAVAFVFRNHVEGCLAPTGGVGGTDDPLGEIPAVGVSREVGRRLARRFEGAEVTISVDAETGPATSQNVHATLGPETDQRLLLTSHVDAHDIAAGAMDNGAGTAMVVEVVNALAAREDELDIAVDAVCFGAEEVGLRGSSHHAGQIDHDSIRAVLNLDGVVQARTMLATTHHFEELTETVRAVSEEFDHPITLSPTMGPHSDHWSYTARGVPACWLHSDTGPGRGWGHTAADTLDKLEPRTFREQAILATALAVELADGDLMIPHKPDAEIADALEAEGLAEGMKATGDWPY